MSLRRDRDEPADGHRSQVHPLLRPPAGRSRARLREGVPDPVDPVRAAGRAAAEGGRPTGVAAHPGRDPGAALRPRRQGLRRVERLLPPDGQARDVRPAERRQRQAAEPQQHRRVRRRPSDRRGGGGRRPGRLPPPGDGVVVLAAEHFVRAPEWLWYILFYFFFAGLAGGAYLLGTLLRFSGDPGDEPAARIAFLVALPATVICPILLTADLGASWMRFWHMMIDVTPGATGLSFKYWSPMSVGAWALLVFGFFVTVSALDAWLKVLPMAVNRAFNVFGSLLAIFIASYTGVLLSVSNQPVWSDTWALGGLFLASGLSGAAALITLLMRYRPEAAHSLERLRIADGYFSILELILLVAFLATVVIAGGADRILPWFPLWIIALLGIGASLYGFRRPVRVSAGAQTAAVTPVAVEATVVAVLVLVAVLA